MSQTDETARRTHRWTAGHWKILIACYLCYMTKTFGEAAFDLTVPARQLQVLAGSNEATATLLSVGSGCYVAGKLLLGQLGDVLGGQVLYAGSLCVAGCAFAGISISTKLWHLCASWGLANFALSSPWTGMMLACTPSWFNKLNGLGTVVAVFGTASRTGVVVSNSILGPLLGFISWNRVIQIGAAAYFAGAAVVMAACSRPKFQAAPTLPATESESIRYEKKVASTPALAKAVVTSPRIVLAFTTSTLLNPIFMFSSVLPIYLTEAIGLTEVAAATVASASPIGAMISILTTTLVWDKLKEKGRWLWCSCSLLLTISASALIGRGRISGRTPMFVALSAMTAGMSSVWSIVGTEFVQVWGGTRAGTLTSWLDAPGYFLTTYFFATYPRLLAKAGWAALWFRLQLFAMMALVSVSGFYFLEQRKPTVQPHPLLR